MSITQLECVCLYPACNARPSYCHLWFVRLYDIFPYYITNGKIFDEIKSYSAYNVFDFN
jgi:hypothetical protein